MLFPCIKPQLMADSIASSELQAINDIYNMFCDISTWICWALFCCVHITICVGSMIYIYIYTVMSLLEAPCVKASWRALLFRAILGITGALIVCFDIWRFKQANSTKAGFGGHNCDFEQHVPWLTVHVCMNSVKFVLEAPGASILWGCYYSATMCRLTWGRFY